MAESRLLQNDHQKQNRLSWTQNSHIALLGNLGNRIAVHRKLDFRCKDHQLHSGI
jgi:hypothetical protein